MKRIILAIIFNIVITTSAYAFLTFNQELDVSTNTTQIRGINFKPDGTIMYVTRRISPAENSDAGRRGYINQYSLRTAFDISTAT